jgi:Transcriptional regulatory protein, C terminal
MLTLAEWLDRVGFQGRNPFALKQADDEGDLLQDYFVEHPAYNAMLDFDPPRSSILHAPRGAGKSSARRMFEDYCTGRAAELRPLLVRMLDWMPPSDPYTEATPIQQRDHIRELFLQTVLALAEDNNASWPVPPRDLDLSGYLNWMCLFYDDYLTPAQRSLLVQRGWVVEQAIAELASYQMMRLPVIRRLELLVLVLQSIGYRTCFVLIDRIDEWIDTTNDWEAGADILAPLIGNLPLNQIAGLAFRYFIPTEIVEALRRRKLIREDRLSCSELSWGGVHGHALLRALLRSRLAVFSSGQIPDLAAISATELREIDDMLVAAANESPRRLLNLGDTLFQICANAADANHLLIEQEHLEMALLAHGIETPLHLITPAHADSEQPPARSALGSTHIPLLRIAADGRIWRGEALIERWQQLPALQRRMLEYLCMHQGSLCSKNKLIDYIWAEKETPADEDSLHKLAGRLIKFIEPDPRQPIYIQRVHGGFYRLDNAAPLETAVPTSGKGP